ncbi:regulation of nuclear pre-mRNA domain-containing protein 2-like isoform X2 [Argiope bruennichi]|nr:regulation of nuclear pre-mRNA domain-containing protein 2-like isoform X2 [Argiope bruennichi]XP_055927021.1 regulation of nuclear pre-mRNA domain-containing protein 2-like isoform X2 [Argiope bruennichi]XP_055927022.1 regulation of nuclear pre-mRNA domain-containing protein 2-like isoform X2 [Argiope bruennichi]
MEIIANYKSQNLFDSLAKLKAVEAETRRKQQMLCLSKPILPDVDKIPERGNCADMMKKFDSYQSLIEDFLKAATNEIKARRNAVKELDNSRVFYDAQYKDVKKVANAYQIYGKRLKNVERALSEKMSVLPSQNENSSEGFSESNSCASSAVGTASFDPDNASVSGTSSKVSPGSIKKRLEQSPKPKFSKLAELFAETKSDSEKQMSLESALTGTSDLKSLRSPNIQNENIADLQITADQQNKVPRNIDLSSAEKSSNQGTSILDCLNEKEETESDNEIEFLLEESYDTKKAKSNIVVKRKMELPLQSKGRHICTDVSEERHSDSKQPSNICVEDEKKSSEDMIEEETMN